MSEVAFDHAVLETLVGAFADGELAGDDVRAVQEHLRTCARGQRELALQQGLSGRSPRNPLAKPALCCAGGSSSWSTRWRVRTFLSSRPWAAPAIAALVVIVTPPEPWCCATAPAMAARRSRDPRTPGCGRGCRR